jgi:amino acid adenylation domain-containing protein
LASEGWDVGGAALDYPSLLDEELARNSSGGDEPPLCLSFIPLGGDRHLIIISAPVIWADSQTLRNFIAELAARLNQSTPASPLLETPIQYVDYAAWRNDLSEQDDEMALEGRDFWRKNFAHQTLDSRLPTQSVAAPTSDFAPLRVPVRLSPDVAGSLAALARQQGESLESMLLAVWVALLHRLTHSSEITVGVVMDGRPHEEFQNSMGLYAQVLPVMLRDAGSGAFSQLLSASGESLRRAGLWQDYFHWPEFSEGDTLFCPYGFVWNPPPRTHSAAGLRFTIVAEASVVDRFELQLACSFDDENITASLNYDPTCFSPSDVERLARRLERLCLAVSQQIDRPVQRLPALTVEDERQLLVEWNQTQGEELAARCLHHCFNEQVERTPDSWAVICGEQRLTYRELNRRANQLARRLRATGIVAETPVALFVGRSVEMLVGLWGILKAGAAYVPLDTVYPVKERIAHVIRDTNAPVILTHKRLRQHVPDGRCEVISLDEDDTLWEGEGDNLSDDCRPDNLAYIIYTSGSTGNPKGVMVEHHSVVNLWRALRRAIYDHLPPQTYNATLNAPISFDASVKQLLLLLGGHILYIPSDEIRTDAYAFVNYLRDNRVDILDCTPSHLRPLLDAGLLDETDGTPSLVLIGGEAIEPVLWDHLANQPATRFYNVYGPTECTGDSTACLISVDCVRPLIGSPLTNTQAYILGDDLQLQPAGVPGELHIGGAGLARGYWNQPALTAQKFVPHPFDASPDARVYKTGDIVRHAPDGRIEYLGRVDQQVKIRGFRVELGEISAALRTHPQVGNAVVTTREDASGNSQLVAYVVRAAALSPSPAELRQHLEGRLPDYMVPAAFVNLDMLPLTANGKVDLKALPAPDELEHELRADYHPPTRPVEFALAEIWEVVLGIKQISVHDDFFKLGGHSLLAMQVIARVRKEFAVEIPIPRLFQMPTIEGLAQAIEAALDVAGATTPISTLTQGAARQGDPFVPELGEHAAVK